MQVEMMSCRSGAQIVFAVKFVVVVVVVFSRGQPFCVERPVKNTILLLCSSTMSGTSLSEA